MHSQNELFTTLNEQTQYVEPIIFLFYFIFFTFYFNRFSVLYAFDEHQVLFPKAGDVEPELAPVHFLPHYFRPFTSWQHGAN